LGTLVKPKSQRKGLGMPYAQIPKESGRVHSRNGYLHYCKEIGKIGIRKRGEAEKGGKKAKMWKTTWEKTGEGKSGLMEKVSKTRLDRVKTRGQRSQRLKKNPRMWGGGLGKRVRDVNRRYASTNKPAVSRWTPKGDCRSLW